MTLVLRARSGRASPASDPAEGRVRGMRVQTRLRVLSLRLA